jgi:hypothetical protein
LTTMKTENPRTNLRQIKSLVEGFRTNFHSLRGEGIPEAVIRQEYIDQFWIALGWDVANHAHRSAAEKDVVIETTLDTVEGERSRTGRPDYMFRIDGFSRFVVEAKKPAVDLKTDKDAIFQAKTYAWSAQIPFAVLMNFESFRLFDATIKPYHAEPGRGVVLEFDLRFEDFENQWDVLWDTFSREAVAKGSLEALLAKIKHLQAGRRVRGIDRTLVELRGTEPVDRVFLQHLEDYRLRFARSLYKENRTAFPEADTHHGAAKLTEATQRLLDRLVFIRVCEDRGIAPYRELGNTLDYVSKNRLDLFTELTAVFRRLDEQYNGYLFKPHMMETLKVPADLLATFIRSLYPPEGPYRFDAIGDDLLGIIYERFLGSTITVKNNEVDAVQKPEVRHAGGVYYTPQFVVDTIVRRVVGPKIAGKGPAEVLGVKILDPACGSGSFLIAALQFLFDHCEKYVAEHPEAASVSAPAPGKTKKAAQRVAFKDRQGEWHLYPKFRARLLSECIYGVDIDAQAVEVTIMSLYLKFLEGPLPPNWQQEFLEGGLLPSLDNNIRCGNSLLSQTDFDRYWELERGSLFGEDEDVRFRINAFDWNSLTRGFGRILNDGGGFDCIIGNPPYIRVQELNKWSPDECEFYKKRYKSAAKGNYDIYVVFIERGLELLAPDGLLGYICPHKFWQATYGEGIRRIITNGKYLREVYDFRDQQVFRGATTYTAIHIFGKSVSVRKIKYCRVAILTDGDAQCRMFDSCGTFDRDSGLSCWDSPPFPDGDGMWCFADVGKPFLQCASDESRFPLVEVVDFSQGFKTGADAVFVVEFLENKKGLVAIRSKATGTTHLIEQGILRPLIKSEHMRRFEIRPTTLRLVFPYAVGAKSWRLLEPDELASRFHEAWNGYLLPLRSQLDKREGGRFEGEHFYQYSRQQNFIPLSKPKLITPDMADHMRVSYDRNGEVVFSGGAAGGVCLIPKEGLNPLLLLGILNSTLMENQVRQQNGTGFRGGYLNCEIRFLRQLPIQVPRGPNTTRLANAIIGKVERILAAKEKSHNGGLGERESERLEREIEAHEAAINELVCRLYGVEMPSETQATPKEQRRAKPNNLFP